MGFSSSAFRGLSSEGNDGGCTLDQDVRGTNFIRTSDKSTTAKGLEVIPAASVLAASPKRTIYMHLATGRKRSLLKRLKRALLSLPTFLVP